MFALSIIWNRTFSLNASQLGKLERCQQCFLKNVFHVPRFAAGKLLLRLANLNSTESEIDLKKLLFLGRLITETKMLPAVKGLFQCRVDDFFNSSLTSIGVLPCICDALRKYDLFHYLQFWHRDLSFPTYAQWKSIVKTKIREKENDEWLSYCQDHPDMHVAQACLLNTPPRQFWSLADDYQDPVSRLHIQVRIMGNFGFNGGVPWLSHTQGAFYFICKENVENKSHFLYDCMEFRQNFDSIRINLKQKVISANPIDGSQIFHCQLFN